VLDIPPAAGWLLDAVGIKYQMLFVDADEIRAFAETVREFARRVSETNDEGTQVVNNLGASWEGASYSALVEAWAHKNNANMAGLQEASEFVAIALDAAATTVQIVQAAVLAELAALGAAFIGAQFASVGTMGASTAVSLAVHAAAHRLVSAMQEILVGYLVAEVLDAAIKPLEGVVERIINAYGRSALADYLGVSNVFRMDPSELERAANTFENLAEQMTGHGRSLADGLADLFQDDGVADFGDDPYRGITDTPDSDAGLPEVGETAAPPAGEVPYLTTDSSVVPAGPDAGAVAGGGDHGLDDLGGAAPYPLPPQPTSIPATGPATPNPNGAPVGAGPPAATPQSSVDHDLGSGSPDEHDSPALPRPPAAASTPPPMDVPWQTESVAPEAAPPGVAASAAPRRYDAPLPAEAASVPWAGRRPDAAPVPWAGGRPDAAPVPWASGRQDAASWADENRPVPGWTSRSPGRPGNPRKARPVRSDSEKHALVGQQDPATADSGSLIPTPWRVNAKAASAAHGREADREPATQVRAVAPASRTDAPKRTDESKVDVVAPEVTPPPRQ
jgi:uncharacterized protein YukE